MIKQFHNRFRGNRKKYCFADCFILALSLFGSMLPLTGHSANNASDDEDYLSAILEDSNSPGGRNNADNDPVTVSLLQKATFILYDVKLSNEAKYQALIAAEEGFSNLPTVEQVQEIIDKGNELDHFVTQWNTVGSGVTSIEIPAEGSSGFSYRVDWNGDGDFSDDGESTIQTGVATHDYGSEGEHTIRISGDFPHIKMQYASNKKEIAAVTQWGAQKWTSMTGAFANSPNMTVTAIDAPDLSDVSDMSLMFFNARSANPDVSEWDVSNVTNMRYLFYGASAATPDVSEWDVSNVTNMYSLFSSASAATPDVSEWDVSNVETMELMFYRASSARLDVSKWDVSNVTNMDRLFQSIDSVEGVSNWNVENVTTMGYMLYGASLSAKNYDAILNEFSSQSVQSNVKFSASPANYCLATNARNNLINDHGWNIDDGGNDCTEYHLSEILEDSASQGGDNNANDNLISVESLADITGLNNVVPDYEIQYQEKIVAHESFDNLPTVQQVQVIIDMVNEEMLENSNQALAAVLEDSASGGGQNNADQAPVTMAQLSAVIGIANLESANESLYQRFVAAYENFSNPPTVEELQAVINSANTKAIEDANALQASNDALAEVLEDSASGGGANNENRMFVTLNQLSAITGLSDIDTSKLSTYRTLISRETQFGNPPTISEVQSIIQYGNSLDSTNSDDDDVINALDADDDNDGVEDDNDAFPLDSAESADADGDGVGDNSDPDNDNDGVSNEQEITAGTDPFDSNSFPGSGAETDTDGDTLVDSLESGHDSDGDGISDHLELDSDNDGIYDLLEANFDLTSARQADVDGDGRWDTEVEGIARLITGSALDSDNDGIPDYRDKDSDNDGVPDVNEFAPLSAFDTLDDDTGERAASSNNLRNMMYRDIDADHVENYRDLDSDNDNIPDLVEAGGVDSDGNGRLDNFNDANGDGILDSLLTLALPMKDSDNDRIRDYLDLDSDQDGITDIEESGGQDTNKDGKIDGFVDINGDGITDLRDNGVVFLDTDNDGIYNHLDTDSDNDGLSDLVESGGLDADGDGMLDGSKDSDNDGLPDDVDVDATGGEDADNDGIDDRYDATYSNEKDTDGDGIIDSQDKDADGDGLLDSSKGGEPLFGAAAPDSDGDGIPDVVDQSSDLVRADSSGGGCSINSGSGVGIEFWVMLIFSVLYLARSRIRSSGVKLVRRGCSAQDLL